MSDISTSNERAGSDASMEERIVAAAERLFVDKGFEQTTTTEIAREAGCNQALIHYYFRTKENLFGVVFKNKIISFWRSFLAVNWEGKTFEDKVAAMTGMHFDLLCENPNLPRFVICELARSPERARQFIRELGTFPRELFVTLGKGLRDAVRSGRVRPMSFIDLLYNILSMNVFVFLSAPIFGGVMNFSDEELRRFLLSRRDETVQNVLKGIRA